MTIFLGFGREVFAGAAPEGIPAVFLKKFSSFKSLYHMEREKDRTGGPVVIKSEVSPKFGPCQDIISFEKFR
jgi:hypothetical protein